MQIIDHPDFEKFDTSSVKNISYGGAPAPPELVARLRANFPRWPAEQRLWPDRDLGGHRGNSGPDYVAKPDSCGPAYPVNEVAIVPEDYVGDNQMTTSRKVPTSWESSGSRDQMSYAATGTSPKRRPRLFQGLAAHRGHRENRR